jgi:aconitate hydratase
MDLQTQPLGEDAGGAAVYLQDIWPSQQEIRETIAGSLNPEMFKDRYGEVFVGPERWRGLPTPEGDVYQWDPDSTYIREVPFFEDFSLDVEDPTDITGARALLVLGDSITTDHISPAGSIPSQRPAGEYLKSKEVEPRDFNTYGARRGNHEVMIRGTFGNIRLRNRLTPEREGDWTAHMPDGEEMSIYDAAMKYQEEGTPLIVIAGKEYGTGSSRDWAAKGPRLLGVKAAIVESFERIHRSNLIGMGILPLEFMKGENAESLGLTGFETYDIAGVADGLSVRKELEVTATSDQGKVTTFRVTCRIDTPAELSYHRHGGILEYVLRQLAA